MAIAAAPTFPAQHPSRDNLAGHPVPSPWRGENRKEHRSRREQPAGLHRVPALFADLSKLCASPRRGCKLAVSCAERRPQTHAHDENHFL